MIIPGVLVPRPVKTRRNHSEHFPISMARKNRKLPIVERPSFYIEFFLLPVFSFCFLPYHSKGAFSYCQQNREKHAQIQEKRKPRQRDIRALRLRDLRGRKRTAGYAPTADTFMRGKSRPSTARSAITTRDISQARSFHRGTLKPDPAARGPLCQGPAREF